MGSELNYRFGASVRIINKNNYEVICFDKDNNECRLNQSSTNSYLKKLVKLNKQKEITNLVNKILSLTRSNDYLENSQKQVKVKEYERQIDQLVYKLYNLTEEEIKIIEEEIK